MAKMRAIDAAVRILEKEGISTAFGVPGAAINPLYSALKKRGSIHHILARHVEGVSHMAEGYTRARAGNIGVCIGTSGPAGTDMITGLYSAIADSIPILCITGQAPRARLYKEDFQAVDIESIARPVTKWAVTVCQTAQVPGTLQQAFYLMRSGRPRAGLDCGGQVSMCARAPRGRCWLPCRWTCSWPRSSWSARPPSPSPS